MLSRRRHRPTFLGKQGHQAGRLLAALAGLLAISTLASGPAAADPRGFTAVGPPLAIAAGAGRTCAATSAGGIKCWGLNVYGELGIGPTEPKSTPVAVKDFSGGVATLALGQNHSCAATETGAAKCWGNNFFGQLGDASTTNRTTPSSVSGLPSGVTALSANTGHGVGEDHTCAVVAGGAKCWGFGSRRLGRADLASSSVPVDVFGLTAGVKAVAAGDGGGCAVTDAGAVQCWGLNNVGQLGNGDPKLAPSATPVPVSGLQSGAVTVGSGFAHSCALMSSGAVKCWGSNDFGQLGDGSTSPRTTPVDVLGPDHAPIGGIVAIAVSYRHSCALTNVGGVKCWGIAYLGDGSQANSSFAVEVKGLRARATAIAVGYSHTCARLITGGVQCWGENVYGQLGNGKNTDSPVPVDVVGLVQGVSVRKAGDGSGIVSSNPNGVDCGSSCKYEFDVGSRVTLSAAAAAGSTFKGWSGDCSGTGVCTLSMNASRSATATFTLNATKQTVVPGVGGRTVAAAVRAIKTAHCSVGRVRRAYSARVAKGRVISESPPGGRHVQKGTKVNLLVSKGKRPR